MTDIRYNGYDAVEEVSEGEDLVTNSATYEERQKAAYEITPPPLLLPDPIPLVEATRSGRHRRRCLPSTEQPESTPAHSPLNHSPFLAWRVHVERQCVVRASDRARSTPLSGTLRGQ